MASVTTWADQQGMAEAPTGVRIAVAAHRPYWMPSDPLYVPVQAGAALAGSPIPGFRRDDEGDGGISELNPHLSELTVLWWAWKRLACADSVPGAVGLAHYRRHFSGSGERGTLTASEAEELLSRTPVLVPRERNYRIETLGSHYDHTFDPVHVDLLVSAMAEVHPECCAALHRHLSGTRGHMFNMLVMRTDLLRVYCEWAFPVAMAVEARLDYRGLSAFERRAPGRLSEFLLDTWLASEGVPFVEAPVRDMEPVNWVRKGGAFLAAKTFGRKYVASF